MYILHICNLHFVYSLSVSKVFFPSRESQTNPSLWCNINSFPISRGEFFGSAVVLIESHFDDFYRSPQAAARDVLKVFIYSHKSALPDRHNWLKHRAAVFEMTGRDLLQSCREKSVSYCVLCTATTNCDTSCTFFISSCVETLKVPEIVWVHFIFNGNWKQI